MQVLCYVYAFSVVSKTNFQSVVFFLDFCFFFLVGVFFPTVLLLHRFILISLWQKAKTTLFY